MNVQLYQYFEYGLCKRSRGHAFISKNITPNLQAISLTASLEIQHSSFKVNFHQHEFNIFPHPKFSFEKSSASPNSFSNLEEFKHQVGGSCQIGNLTEKCVDARSVFFSFCFIHTHTHLSGGQPLYKTRAISISGPPMVHWSLRIVN